MTMPRHIADLWLVPTKEKTPYPDVSYETAQLEAIVAVGVSGLDRITAKIAGWKIA